MLWMTLGCTSIIEGSRNFPCRFMILKWISTGLISLSAGHFLLGSTIRGQTLETVHRLFVECMPRWHPFLFCNVKLQGNLRTHRFLTFLSWLSDCVTSRREKKGFQPLWIQVCYDWIVSPLGGTLWGSGMFHLENRKALLLTSSC